jgi:transposase
MKPPLFVRRLTDAERQALEAGLQSRHTFTLRRAQILLASARREPVPRIARSLGCSAQTVRNSIHAFAQRGLASLQPRSHAPHRRPQTAFPGAQAEVLRDLLHRSPRDFGRPTSLWTVDLAAEISAASGLTATQVSGETIRATLARLDVRWRHAKQWIRITSPDPASLRTQERATA